MSNVIMIGQLLLSLSLLIVLHEMGHFFPARWFKTRVDKFYLFFDWGGSLFKFKRGDTEYGIGWLPLGGYVKIAGMVDESFDREQLAQAPQPWEFRSKPAWQRLIIMLGGVTVNFILGMLLFIGVTWYYGNEFIPAKNVKDGLFCEEVGKAIGLQTGDYIISVGDKPFEKFDDIAVKRAIIFDNAKTMLVRRDSQEITIAIPDSALKLLTSRTNAKLPLFAPRFPYQISEFSKGMEAGKSGLKVGDKITGLNGQPIRFLDELVANMKLQKGKVVDIQVMRGDSTLNFKIQADTSGKIGIGAVSPLKLLGSERQDYTLMEAIPAGWNRGWTLLANQINAFGKIFRNEIKATESMGGFGSIATMFGNVWDWERFWALTATLSLVLAFMNLLPIPALDGGHVVFLLYEIISGRKPSDKVLENATMVGFILVFALILFVNGLDIWHAIKGYLGFK